MKLSREMQCDLHIQKEDKTDEMRWHVTGHVLFCSEIYKTINKLLSSVQLCRSFKTPHGVLRGRVSFLWNSYPNLVKSHINLSLVACYSPTCHIITLFLPSVKSGGNCHLCYPYEKCALKVFQQSESP